MKSRTCILVGLAMLLNSVAYAQNFSIDWFTIDGGGGTSTGGVFRVSGTAGQPDAGVMSGGNFVLQGGFWAGAAIQTPGAPFLYITNGPAGMVIYWERPATGFVLDETLTLTGSPAIPWMQVPFPYQTNTTHIYVTVPAPDGIRFYRLRHP
jgi:hypothetical protein